MGAHSDGLAMAPGGDDPTFNHYLQFPMELQDEHITMDQQDGGEPKVKVELNSVLGNWSVGSTGHHFGRCKPCAFFWKDGCKDAQACQFCHTCPPEEKKNRKQQKLAWRKAVRAAHVSLKYRLF